MVLWHVAKIIAIPNIRYMGFKLDYFYYYLVKRFILNLRINKNRVRLFGSFFLITFFKINNLKN